jgi:pyridoxine 5-phosphate synthase
VAEAGGADGITVHLREDRRHIQDRDVERLRAGLRSKLNLEMAATSEMLAIALAIRPDDVCIVPERRAELTTEGGLDVLAQGHLLPSMVERLAAAGIRVSLFVDPESRIITAVAQMGATHVELHTGEYSGAVDSAARARQLERLRRAAVVAHEAGLVVNGGHGLTYDNVQAIAALPHLWELNIGHSIVARAVFVGIETAVREMKALVA